MMYDLIVIGSGAAGLSAAIYAGRYRMKVLVIGAEFGGYTSVGGSIENYPGFTAIDGLDLMLRMKEQAQGVGAEVIDGWVSKVEHPDHCFIVTVDEKEYVGKTIIFGVGSKHRELGLPHEKELVSKGIHYCATCDAPLYGKKTVAVVGGGDGAVKAANLLAEYAEKIYVLVRAASMRAEPINVDHMKEFGDKVEILFETQVKEITTTEGKFSGILLTKLYKDTDSLPLDGLFIEIGANPQSDLAKSIGIELDIQGYIKVDPLMRTNIEGAYAAGDIANLFGGFKQDITAAAMGSVAATSAYQDYRIHGDLCKVHWKVAPEK
ncbi:MAG: FAD-dependent oxidoreductase [bacterium]|nr:FAD-dependent oxidoreductase [bacterium]